MFLFVDDILLASGDFAMLSETKHFLSNHFDTKDIGDASFVIFIEVHRDRSNGKFIYHKEHILRKCERYGVRKSKPSLAPIAKGDKFK